MASFGGRHTKVRRRSSASEYDAARRQKEKRGVLEPVGFLGVCCSWSHIRKHSAVQAAEGGRKKKRKETVSEGDS